MNVPTSWGWEFNNVNGGNVWTQFSTLQNPPYTFGVGNFSIRLTAANVGGSNLSTQVTFINVSAAVIPPVASFASNVTSGTAPLLVQFNDTSMNVPTSWGWEFNNVNGGNVWTQFSTLQNPQYTFGVGNFSIRLTAANTAGNNLSVQRTYINVSLGIPASITNFKGKPTTGGKSPLKVQFTDLSTNNPSNWDWYWYANETKSSDLQNPVAVFTTGTYSIRLYTSNSGGGSWMNKSSYISVKN
jgi:PKD repeat protein